ncbi:OsmC family protein [Embleya hyalina]|uniref:Uncharacterized protein n=1 Tax=Embleya hyalina TaxID=516124 RepID=A0A401Z1U7_9ACTN|nr:OsmC family protein [Embleya hyalina]GCE00792.1 hypothetical protein EHYA_08518 [Embleya hyalina]
MRNSFNTASFSEVVHEIREDASEGLFRYVGRARHSPLRGLSAEVGPAMFGRVKSARRFTYALRDPFTPVTTSDTDEPTPIDLALTGIGSCSLMTLVGGGSAKGIVFDAVSVDLTCDHADKAPVTLDFAIDAEIRDERIDELIQRVRQRSPNYATLVAAVPVHWAWEPSTAPTRRGEPADPTRSRRSPARPGTRHLRWLSGPQSESFAHPFSAAATALRVDNPKQLTGVDWGPNPQEYLMMGYAAEVAAHLGAHSRSRLGHEAIWEVTARCTEDVSGLLRADPAAVVHLQDVGCRVSMSSPAASHARSIGDIEELVDEAVSTSAIGRLISEPQIVDMAARRPASSPSAR